ncbi:hypothetical protein BJX96DRAFT_87862 [Aspergillus floccosus]
MASFCLNQYESVLYHSPLRLHSYTPQLQQPHLTSAALPSNRPPHGPDRHRQFTSPDGANRARRGGGTEYHAGFFFSSLSFLFFLYLSRDRTQGPRLRSLAPCRCQPSCIRPPSTAAQQARARARQADRHGVRSLAWNNGMQHRRRRSISVTRWARQPAAGSRS